MPAQDYTTNDIMQALNSFADRVEKRFDRLEKGQDELRKGQDELRKGQDELCKDVTKLQQDVERIYNILDTHMKRIEDILQENAIRDHQQARMERWIFQLADKLDVKLQYD